MSGAAGAYLRLASPAGRWVLVAAVLGSSIAMLDATVVNVALPRIGRDLGGHVADLQWTINAYTLTLAAFLLAGGSLGDVYGRRRLFVIGTVWFTIASLACAFAATMEQLIAARAVQGIGGALLVPESLAVLESSIHVDDRSAAIGAWSGLGGVATAIGPLLGGWLVEAFSWRVIFLLNVPLAIILVWISARHVPGTRDAQATRGLDLPGAALGAAGLVGVIYALTRAGELGWSSRTVLVSGTGGLIAFAAMLVVESRTAHPMLPLELFRSRPFTAANLVTVLVYAALGGTIFLLPIVLQRAVGLTPLQSGAALVPVTILMLAFSMRAGRLAQRIGPRWPMTLGPITAGIGLMLLTRLEPGGSYVAEVLPAMLVFGVGLTLTVAPLTSTALGAIGEEHAGIASAVNNAVSRVAGLVAVAALPAIVGLSDRAYGQAADLAAGFHRAMWITGGLCVAGGVVAFMTIRGPGALRASCLRHCALEAMPLRGRP